MPSIKARQLPRAQQLLVLHQRAAVLHHLQTSGAGALAGGVVLHAQLQPQRLGTNGDGFVGNRRYVGAVAKHVHQVNLQVLRGRAQSRPAALAQNLARHWVDRHDAVALLLQILGDVVAVALGLGREADDGNRAAVLQDAVDGFGGLWHGYSGVGG